MRTAARIIIALLVTIATALAAPPAGAHDPEEHGDHAGPGSAGPDLHSKNMKLQSNVARAAGTTTQSDLAFWGKHAFVANYQGFRVVDIADPEAPVVVGDFRCNGAQGDISVYGNLLFQSVDAPQSHAGCSSSSTGVNAATPGMFEGVRVFDISAPSAPVHLTSVQTPCGSHTHTLVPDAANGRVFLYVSSYPLGGAAIGPDCRAREHGDGHSKISIVEVPLATPAAATVSPYFLDDQTQWATYLGQYTLRACHDISVFTELKLAAAACMSEAQLWDISDPAAPRFLWRYDNPAVQPANTDLFHSATFSWDGRIVAFGDESGGGGAARCTDPGDPQGRIWFVDRETAAELGSYKVPRAETGTCTMHNFNFVPLRGRNVLVSSAYTAGTTVVDVDALLDGAGAAASEIGFYRPSGANTWSSYWYNGRVYANDILRGMDVFNVADRAVAGSRRLPYLNPQTQESVIR